ncbi:hypothetical protein A2U01_0111621, partial [Trifolium medium]|nr:hypothetical protein [Trifolium medium]
MSSLTLHPYRGRAWGEGVGYVMAWKRHYAG